jgi:DNA topoisomerase VI subunit B
VPTHLPAHTWLAAGDARVFEGHAFVVEAAVSIGGRDVKPGINIFRFANRIPLLFEVGGCMCTHARALETV